MTLSKQLIIITSLLFTILFIGTLAVSINNMRDYLTQQLESHAQDTASSLGLSLTPHIKSNDVPIMKSMVDAIFDRGYYLDINIIAIDGKPIIERKNNTKVEDVPAWFVESIQLDTPQGKTTISNGWKQAAHVYVRSHPGYAYRELWQNAVDTFGWFILSFAIAIVSFILALRYILLPLKRIEHMALAITRREFPIQDAIPKTRELKRVVVAMNRMSEKVKNMLLEQTGIIKRVQKEIYIDNISELANNRSFDLELDHVISNPDGVNYGLLLFVKIKDLETINNESGYQQGDTIIRQVAEVIKHCVKEYPQAIVARIAGGQFGIVISGISLSDSNELTTDMAHQIPLVNTEHAQTDFCHLGGAYYQGKTEIKELLAKAEQALQTSLTQGPNNSLIYSMDEEASPIKHGAQLWEKMLKLGIQEHKLSFYQQPVISLKTNKILHHEIYTKLHGDDGEVISDVDFIPLAEKMGLMPELDKNIVENFINVLKQKDPTTSGNYSLNISPSSFQDADFVQWLYQKLQSEPEAAKQLILETSEYVVNTDIEIFKKTINEFQNLGCRFSLDHFGVASTPFGYLHDLKINFIKIHGGLVRGIYENDDNRFYIQSLCQIAHGLDIQVIGEFVETEEDYIGLTQLSVDAAQGYYLGQVKEVF